MGDQTSDRNNQIKATMRDQASPNLNKSGKAGVVVKSPTQGNEGKPPKPQSQSKIKAKYFLERP